jgi:putative FmdB family regulatory protein
MPIYDYQCQKCTHKFEVRRGFNDTTEVTCPRCQCRAERVFSPVPIIFKGSGFYVTDTANEKTRQSPVKSGESKPDTGKNKESAKSK